MVSDIDIYRTANIIIKQYGDQALFEAQDRVERFQKIGDADAIKTWSRIVDAIDFIQGSEPPKSGTMQ